MDPDKVIKIQKQVRDDVKTLQSYLTDLQSWEAEMKRKEAALKGEFEQDLPPVRSKVKKEKPVVPVKNKPEKRISASDYSAWEKFDVDKACEEVEMADIGPSSLDSKKSQQDKQEKLREEAQYEKERGNNFVKQEKWDEAIACYNRAIELIKDDAIYYANRGLCYLKKDSLHQAEKDCTEALALDPTYVKALQRRATARERLGSLRAASEDLNKVISLEPHNTAARKQLQAIKIRMGTKGSKLKSSSTQSSPTVESKTMPTSSKTASKIIELDSSDSKVGEKKTEVKEKSVLEKWRDGEGEPITVIKPVKKPPHLRSKRALKPITIQEIPLGCTEAIEKPPTRLNIIEIDDTLAKGDSNNNSNDGDNKASPIKEIITDDIITSPESEKLVERFEKEEVNIDSLVAPVNSVQFMAGWKNLRGHDVARCHYLSLIDPDRIPSIFANALESDVLSELLRTLASDVHKYRDKTVTAYLKGIVRVKRFSALAMFLSDRDKELVNKLLKHCAAEEKCPENDLADLKNKFEI